MARKDAPASGVMAVCSQVDFVHRGGRAHRDAWSTSSGPGDFAVCKSCIMKNPTLSLLAAIALASPLALHSVPATAAQELRVADPAITLAARTFGEPAPMPEGLQPGALLDQDELAAFAALEAEHAELQQQQAGFFGPRIGTILIIVLLVVLLL
jgi:hypothetical protein